MAEPIEKLFAALVARGLVEANLQVEQSNYIFADGHLEIQGKSSLNESRAERNAATQAITKFSTREDQFPSTLDGKAKISLAQKAKKNESPAGNQADEFRDDYFQPKKIYKTNKRPWTVAATVFLSTAVLVVAILFIADKIGKNTIRQNESGQQSLQADATSSSHSDPNPAEANYGALFKEANELLASGQLELARQKAEQAEKIMPTEELASLKRAIKEQQEQAANVKVNAEYKQKEEVTANEIARANYLEAYDRFRRDDLVKAEEYLEKAKQIRNGPDIKKKEIELQTIHDLINSEKERMRRRAEIEAQAQAEEEKRKKAEAEPKELARNNYLDISRKYLKKGLPEQAMKYLMEAKKIRISPESIALENQIEALYAENLNKQGQSKPPAVATSAAKTTSAQTEPPPAIAQVKILPGKISDLAAGLSENFSALVKRIEITGFESTFSPSGFITITIRIDEKGSAQVKDINDNNLSLEPELFRQGLRSSVTNKLNGLRFPEPKNRDGERITVENWRLNFKMGKFSGKIIMNRQ